MKNYENTSKKYPASEGWYISHYNTSDCCAGMSETPIYERINPDTGRKETMSGMQWDAKEQRWYNPDGTVAESATEEDVAEALNQIFDGFDIWA